MRGLPVDANVKGGQPMPVSQTELAPNTFVQSSNLFQVNSVVISGRAATLLIDPAWYPDELAALRTRVAATPAGTATHLGLTHCDGDHVGRVNDFGDLPIIASPVAPSASWADTAGAINEIDITQLVVRDGLYRPPLPGRFTALETLDLGGERLLFFPVAGHTADSQFIVVPGQRLLIAGDYLHDILSPIIRTSVADYRAALMKALEICDRFDIEQVVPGHGRIVRDGAEIRRRAAVDIDYTTRLEAALRQAAGQGLGVDDTVTQLKDFDYGRDGLTPYMRHLHANNIRKLLPAMRADA